MYSFMTNKKKNEINVFWHKLMLVKLLLRGRNENNGIKQVQDSKWPIKAIEQAPITFS